METMDCRTWPAEQIWSGQLHKALKLWTAELHHFCDASEIGYGTASYLWLTNNKTDVHVTFVLGKSRVIPLKQITIPRLELAAASLAVKIDRCYKENSIWNYKTLPFGQTVHLYSNTFTTFHTYVANRVATIHKLSKENQWRHVSSKDNPADYASHGLKMETFLDSATWLNSPGFLSQIETEWPEEPRDTHQILSNDPEIKEEEKTTELLAGC